MGGAVSETWRLLETWDGEPGFNMALDEALFLEGGERPVLRFYTWRPDALSLGYFQRLADVPERDLAAVRVRRLTGGGAIHHAEELTFSITAPLAHPLYRGNVQGSYERVHGLLAEVFATLGVRSALRRDALLASDREGTGMCFHHSTPLDLAWGGRKGVGSAQRRTRGRVLHHGSIKLGRTELDTGVAGLREHVPDLDAPALARAIRGGFEARLAVHFAEEPLSDSERELALDRAEHFTSGAFLHRR